MVTKKAALAVGLGRVPNVLTAIFLLTFGINPAFADAVINGPSCVIDGNTVQIGSKLKDGKCWGGIDVRLHGSVAPGLKDTCTRRDGTKWACGKAAKDALSTMIKQYSISCFHIDGEFVDKTPVVTCISGRLDLALELVKRGMAKALHDQSKRYELEETDAKRAPRGIWK